MLWEPAGGPPAASLRRYIAETASAPHRKNRNPAAGANPNKTQTNLWHTVKKRIGGDLLFQNRLRRSNQKIRQHYGPAGSRTLYLTGAAGAIGILLGIGKILSGILAASVFACMNGGYTLGMALAKYCALIGAARSADEQKQYPYYKAAGAIMTAASILYVCYSLWSIRHPKPVFYGDIAAITIATITFAEIGLNVRGILRFRKVKTPLLHALKIIGLGTSLISLVLTQAAILAFADEGSDPAVNGLLGAVTGTAAALLGCYMLLRIRKLERNSAAARAGPADDNGP